MKVRLLYGKTGLDLAVPSDNARVIEPRFVPGLSDEAAGFRDAARRPIGAAPLAACVGSRERLAVVIPDGTRPFPSERVLPWLFAELSHVAPERVTIVIGTGSHRANTPEEIRAMVGADVAKRYRIVNHDAGDPETMADAGGGSAEPVRMNRAYVEADRRIVLGFIEPHFFAGFSGGYKAVFPGVADIESILRYHRAEVIADPRSTWGVLDANPTQEQVRRCGSLLPVDFAVQVALNRRREVVRFFCGDVLAAHEEGCRFVKQTAMVACARRWPVVVTTNGGYPLDQSLYQAVKGMSAAAQIVEPGGCILAAAECADGFPEHGNFRKLLFEHATPRRLLDAVLSPGFRLFDQWEAQKLAMILLESRVALHSRIAPDDVRRAHLEPVPDPGAFLATELRRCGGGPVAVLPEGPMTIPYVD